jgi:hypothetical protein
MKRALRFFYLMLGTAVLIAPFSVTAVSYYPIDDYFYVGTLVCLFQSGTAEIKKQIHIQDTLPVVRKDSRGALGQVGKIVVKSYIDDDYLLAEVIDGALLKGDIAKKGDAACLLVSAGEQCKR